MTTTSAAGATALTPRQTVQAMSGLMMGLFVAILAGTVVSTALPRIIHDLGASQSSYTWVVTLELLTMTATVPLWGKLADLYNNKLLVQVSLGFFVSARWWPASPRTSRCCSAAGSCRASAPAV